ncbi:type 1 glutamine amidotransferase domain-containing protein [Pseudomonas syringae]|nr:type 1 glutamine amidotransferase domain-containing protein [Pseudomonas syringae]MBD8792791.1 type 1 glutamine amidotransferase domain-containing protein [Pseudomonas syringae]MBD8803294.1 type 1 glutamine amidotransferase domain-containing protein [Pseudomonas syringae]MBD8811891.1 type 1 glutamine amidotransferase domain-containing protein [Pseudomonas syringae]
MKVLMVLTSHDQLGNTGKKTGFWLEEFAAPYYVFKDAGAEVVLASPAGGQPPLDPKSDEPDAQTEATERYKADDAAQQALAHTVKLDTVKVEDFDTVFYPGGHGPLWDLAESQTSINLIEAFLRTGRPIGFVCHAPGVLRHVKAANGALLIEGRRVTGFTNSEEEAVGLTDVVPFLIETEFEKAGALYEKGPDWGSFVVEDDRLITGQNPASSEGVARTLIELVRG